MLSVRANLPTRLHVQFFVLVLTILSYNPFAYNINWRNPQVFSDPTGAMRERGSYFGFSVALYMSANDSLLLVGAPRANSSEHQLKSVNEPGTVFKCLMNGVCEEWVIDMSKNGPFPMNKNIFQIRNNSWIGATIAVENKTTANVVVCGPRWTIKPHYVHGICYTTLATGANTFEKPAKTLLHPFSNPDNYFSMWKDDVIYFHAMTQGGFSIHINSLSNGINLALGSPGFYFWKGGAVLASSTDSFSRITIPSVARIKPLSFFSYLGYAITAGAYFKQQDIWYAASAPRSLNLFGHVVVFKFPSKSNQQLNVATVLQGEQYGELYGAALTSCDINSDGRHELIVGSPHWSRDMDEGRVYVYTVQQNMKFKEIRLIEGEVIKGRLGSALACLGDIDYDGYGDIAISAPYEEDNGGAVYIYNGNRNGISSTYSQKLLGMQFSRGMRGFGISISEPRDINRDNYSDIAVGAYLSEKVVLLKSLPVITVNVTIMYLEEVKLLKDTESFKLDLQVYYVGAYVPETLRIVKILKLDQLYGRAVYSPKNNNQDLLWQKVNGTYRLPETLQRNTVSSSPLTIYLKKDIQNVIDPIEIFASVHVEADLYATHDNSSEDALCTSCVVINKFLSKTEDFLRVPFVVECGDDNVCSCDLAITSSVDLSKGNRYIIGSTPTITLHIDVKHRGEAAYQTKVHIAIEVLSLASIPSECVEDSYNRDIFEVTCDIGNPLRTNKTLTLQLDVSTVTYNDKQAAIRTNVSTQSEEKMLDNNSHITIVYFDIDVDIAIVGKPQIDIYSYLDENQKEPLNNITFQHFYEVQQFGISPIEEVALTVKIPTHWRHRTGDLELAEINNTIGLMNGYQFYCNDMTQTNLLLFSEPKTMSTGDTMVTSLSHIMGSSVHMNFSTEKNALTNMPSENRVLYINCTNEAVQCAQINCRLGPFKNSLSVARLLITQNLRLSNFHATLMKDKDIIYFVSEGSVIITHPYNITQKISHKSDIALVATTFLGTPVPQRIAVWIIALSVVLGIILLILLILGLIKIGFFNRKKKTELEALKAETDQKHNVTLETTSSTEVLDHD